MATEQKFPDPPSDTVLALRASIEISAPAAFVFDIITTPSTWSSWCTFCPGLEVTQPDGGNDSKTSDTLKLGTKMNLQVRMDPNYPQSLRTQKAVVSDFSAPQEENVAGSSFSVSWQAEGFPRFLLRANRTSECVVIQGEDGNLMCEYRTWEYMAGPTARVVKSLYGTSLQARFDDTGRDLKAYAEKEYSSRNEA